MHHTIVPYSTDLPHVWQEIRKLDEEENWTERTQILTKEDHTLYLEVAKVRKMYQLQVFVLIQFETHSLRETNLAYCPS